MLVQKNTSLRPYNTFGLDENAGFLAVVDSVEDLDEIYQSSRFRRHRKMVLGGGSNVLFTRGFTGVIAKNEIKGVAVVREDERAVIVSAGAGESWHQLVLWCVERGYGGIENLSLIPGTVGAAPMQNIGAYGVELKEVFHSLEAYEIKSGKTTTFYKEDCHFDYRYSVFKGELKNQFVITRVFLKLTKQHRFNVSYGAIRQTLEHMGIKDLTLKAVSQAVINIRQAKLPDPIHIGNAGSFFKNPVIDKLHFEALEAQFGKIKAFPVGEGVKIPAAWLIEKAGWKGYREGDIGVHEKQALVLVNYGNGRGKDLFRLSRDIQQSVSRTHGIDLEREVNVI